MIESWDEFIIIADEYNLVGEQYVWFTSDLVVGLPAFSEKAANLSRGLLGTFQKFPITNNVIEFVSKWNQLDPTKYIGAGPNIPPIPYTFIHYDAYITIAKAIQSENLNFNEINGEKWTNSIRNLTFDGVSGKILFDTSGDRITTYSILFYDPEKKISPWSETAIWDPIDGYQYINDVIWYDNTTTIPDLDIREPFHYWSCHKKEKLFDETGKTIQLHSPDGSDIDDIDSDYLCDQFIDCKNISDESFSCSNSNFILVFIIFGILTGFLIFIAIGLIIFIFIFGSLLGYRRLRSSSPTFLILMLFSIVIGYCSIFSWFGKPHPVSCAFQPWLLGLSVLSMFNALTCKTFRIWRIFKFPLAKINISNFELIILWFLCMIPAVVILVLWTIISTPTAVLMEQDGKDHYVCYTGGFTGYPGGYVFFSIFVAYSAFILFLGAVLCFLIRHVPSQFNESKLIAISIYNLVFLSVVIVPVYMVLISYEPFIAWIIRTCAILYAFTATMILQFLPKIIGIIFIDKFKNVKVFKSPLQNSISLNRSISQKDISTELET